MSEALFAIPSKGRLKEECLMLLARAGLGGVHDILAGMVAATAETGFLPDIAALESDLSDTLGLKVDLADKGGKGALTLRYVTLEQLDELCRRLMRG